MKKIFSWIKEIVFLVVVIAVVLNLISYLKRPDLKSPTLPKFELLSINNKTINSNDFKEKPLIIHFWATWCPACKLEAPNIQALSKSANIITVAVNSGTDEELKIFLKQRDFDFMVFNDLNGEFATKFKVSSFPTTFIYDKSGEISSIEVGYTSTIGLKIRYFIANR